MQVLGGFENHEHYDGVFIGKPGADWHLEFTVSDNEPEHTPDADDLLVFYLQTEADYVAMQQKFADARLEPVMAKNPYWKTHGKCYLDPDGYGIIISVQNG